MTNILLAGDVEKSQFNSLLKVLSILVLKLRGQSIKSDLKPVADTQIKDAKAILKKLGTDVSLFDDMYDNILKRSATVEPYALAFVKDLRKRIRETNLTNNLDNLTIKQKEVMNYIFTLISSPDSEGAYSSLQRRISNLGDKAITKRFIEYHAETGDDPAAVRSQIEALVQKLTGRKGQMSLTTEENKKFADNDDKKEIGKLRSKYAEAVRQKIKKIVLDSGESRLKVSIVMKKLKESGTGVTPYPSVFSTSKHIYVDLDAQLCNVNGDPLNQKSLSPTFTFELNQSYDPAITTKGKTWLYKAINPENGNSNYIGTSTLAAQNKGAKFDKLSNLLSTGEIHTIKKRWRAEMKSGDLDNFDNVAAMLTEYLYQTSSRIGSEEGGGNTGGVQTFGATTFKVSSVKKPADGSIPKKLKISYMVKGGHAMTFTLDPTKSLEPADKTSTEKLIAFLVAKCKGKKPSDPVFTVGAKRIDPTAYNNWLKQHTTMTAHNFRTLRGSEVALKVLPGALAQVKKEQNAIKPKKLADAKVHKIFEEAMTKVGEILGHIRRDKEGNEVSTANTSIAYYVDAKIQMQWYRDAGYAPSNKVVAAARRANIAV
jgi:hypothetical protein